jgi:hypothetical protein
MGGTLEKQNLEHGNDYPEIIHNGKSNKNKNNKKSIEEQSTKSLVKPGNDNKSQHKRNGAAKKKKNDKVSIIAKDKDINL